MPSTGNLKGATICVGTLGAFATDILVSKLDHKLDHHHLSRVFCVQLWRTAGGAHLGVWAVCRASRRTE